jgi:tetratricopeptide (TPR) repeat protein
MTPEQKLEQSRKELASGNTENAVSAYAELIKDKDLIDLVIEDLQLALERQPENPGLWQTLGDAYMNKDQLTEAIEAYRRGMESA